MNSEISCESDESNNTQDELPQENDSRSKQVCESNSQSKQACESSSQSKQANKGDRESQQALNLVLSDELEDTDIIQKTLKKRPSTDKLSKPFPVRAFTELSTITSPMINMSSLAAVAAIRQMSLSQLLAISLYGHSQFLTPTTLLQQLQAGKSKVTMSNKGV
ncbi:uncharacterized protein LOC143240408 [Tachypleus tridentatus]|uniref:uncharacterized protein LOC143240408 n=1 Tax=Tachypleus tridentatus TaxID=6853 RepID=UPI003FD07D11